MSYFCEVSKRIHDYFSLTACCKPAKASEERAPLWLQNTEASKAQSILAEYLSESCNALMDSKVQIRQRMQTALQFSPETMAAKSELLCAALLRDEAWAEARTVAVFAPHKSEPAIEPLAQHSAARTFCYPRIRENELDFFRVIDPAALIISRWKLREPPAAAEHAIALEEIDLILVPGVAFTRIGERLGRGGGFYDRLLGNPKLRAVRIGVCFEAQIVDVLPSEPHDMKMDRVVTEMGIF